jgi:thiol-disulfide isomerase/thioredoxin
MYVFGMSENIDDSSYKVLIDELVIYIGDENAIIKTSLLDVIWNRFIVIENNELAGYINDTYLFDLANKTDNAFLINTLIAYKNNAVGAKAADFQITSNKNGKTTTTSLHKLDVAEEYLLIFWSSTCGHCLNELPEVMELTAIKPNLKVIAFGLEDDNENWQKEIKNLPNFMHVIGLDKWNNTIAKAYNIKATPSYFLLDKNKIIVAKPEQLEDLIKVLE